MLAERVGILRDDGHAGLQEGSERDVVEADERDPVLEPELVQRAQRGRA